MDLSIVILSYKHVNHLRICLGHLTKLQFRHSIELIVVDNASGDDVGAMMEEYYPNIPFIQNEKNVGHPAGNNVGLAEAKGRYVAIMNPDIIVRDAAEIDAMIDWLDANTDVAVLGPRLHNPDGTVQSSCYRRYGRFTPIYRRTLLGKTPWAVRDIQRHLMTDFDHNATIDVEWLLGAFMIMRSSVCKELGYLDESLFLYFGDYELCDRVRQNGYRVVYFHEPKNIIHYHKRESASSRFTLMQVLSYVTRLHLKDWRQYLRLVRSYDKLA